MPGFSQLKKFNSDLLSLGNEPELRAKRGEKVSNYSIPKGIKDEDDSDDFVMGMPEPNEESIKQSEEKPDAPEDFSDIMGTSTPASSSSSEEVSQGPSIAVPDLSSLVSFGTNGDDNSSDSMVPDLSMFMDEEPEVEEEPEEEKEPEIADLSLEDLLGGSGFDGSSGTEENPPEEEETHEEDSAASDFEIADLDAVEPEPVESVSNDFDVSGVAGSSDFDGLDPSVFTPADDSLDAPQQKEALPTLDELFGSSEPEEKPAEDFSLDDLSTSSTDTQDFSLEDLSTDTDSGLTSFDAPEMAEVSEIADAPEMTDASELGDELDAPEAVESLDDLVAPANKSDLTSSLGDIEDLTDLSEDFTAPEADLPEMPEEVTDIPEAVPEAAEDFAQPADSGFDFSTDGLDSIGDANGSVEDASDGIESLDAGDFEPGQSFSLDDLADLESESSSNSINPGESFSLDDLGALQSKPDAVEDAGEIEAVEALEDIEAPASEEKIDDFDGIAVESVDIPVEEPAGVEDSAVVEEAPAIDEETELKEEFSTEFGTDMNLDDMSLSGDFDIPVEEMETPAPAETASDEDISNPAGLFDSNDMELPEFDADKEDEFKTSDFGDVDAADSLDDPFASVGESSGSSSDDDFLSNIDFNLDDAGDDSSASSFDTPDAPLETFDTSEMDGMEFPDTDSHLSETGDFELGNSDDIQMEAGDFEIPGFSDVDTVQESKNGKIEIPNKEAPVSEDGKELPPNTLTDAQYSKFLKNLAYYPLNVRIAVEDLIVKNEFTDEAEFEIIQKVLKRVPARQLASELEKMLDISLSVPRDYERRTQEEYEAYKSSFQYQLRNKIIPAAIVSAFAAGLCVLLFFFARNFIYYPARATSLYKQGYKLLLSEDYPSSEIKFNEAVRFEAKKNWFFKYARGYREKNQYIRAENMYKNILNMFKHDKLAGLEYADMEMSDLANYESAEKVLLREVLDYHINDKDALLLLGDNYLEWGTEKDPEKLENARVRYSDLMHLYGVNLLYLSRMMRYFIRTDNLLEVLQLKENFMPHEKSLGSADWTELSGFLLDKLHGPLSPSEEYLRSKIEDVKECLKRAVRADGTNPVALYNMSRYYVKMNNPMDSRNSLERTLTAFKNTKKIKQKDMYKYIDTYRLLGELFVDEKEYLKAREKYTDGIMLFQNIRDQSGLKGTEKIGNLYSDLGDIDYFIAGDMNGAQLNYEDAIKNDFDTPQIRYKVGYIQYNKNKYQEALGSFMKATEDYPDDPSVLLAMGNTLSLKNDNYAAQGYYEHLLSLMDLEKEQKGILFPQVHTSDYEIVDNYLKGKNNLGVTLSRLARRTGNSNLNARAISNFQDSLRAWDAMTRNQETLIRLGGSNLAEQNIRYLVSPVSAYEPAIYTDIPKTLVSEEGLKQ